jgi:pimeloyl-ACP methyl ester carboxylesterase
VSDGPRLPPGRFVDLPGRGRTFVREVGGPPGATTLLLLHGWTATSDLTWFPSYEALGRVFRVVALDHRGHGRGIRSRRPFRLTDCAEDAAALLELLATGPVTTVGYSMGGPVAQLLWRRHPELVSGMVLCATSRTFASKPRERVRFGGLAAVAIASRAVPRRLTAEAIARAFDARRTAGPTQGWAADELRRNDWTAVLEAGGSLGRFDSRQWIGDVDVPVAVVATMRDSLVAPARQLALARSIPGARVFPVQGDHAVCVTHPRRFVPALLDACQDVAARAAVTPR